MYDLKAIKEKVFFDKKNYDPEIAALQKKYNEIAEIEKGIRDGLCNTLLSELKGQGVSEACYRFLDKTHDVMPLSYLEFLVEKALSLNEEDRLYVTSVDLKKIDIPLSSEFEEVIKEINQAWSETAKLRVASHSTHYIVTLEFLKKI